MFSVSYKNNCYIFNIFDNFDTMLSNIFEKSSNYDFKTYNLGIILKPSFLERDDYLKSKYKIKGIENIKFGIATELGKKISRRTKSKSNIINFKFENGNIDLELLENYILQQI